MPRLVPYDDEDASELRVVDVAVATLQLWRDPFGWNAPHFSAAPSSPAARSEETYNDLLRDTASFEDFDADTKGARSHGATVSDQLALEHLLGAR